MKQTTLVILDGWGQSDDPESPLVVAKTPFFDQLVTEHGVHSLAASGMAVGLPEGQAGNSEAGHSVIGLGRPMESNQTKINRAIAENEFATRPVFGELFNHVQQHGTRLHVLGLMSPGGVHSHINHVFAFLNAAKAAGVEQVYIHAFTDGRDTPPCSAVEHINQLQEFCEKIDLGMIVTLAGRFYAMDRDGQWDRVDAVADMLFADGGTSVNQSVQDVIEAQYNGTCFDEFVPPVSLGSQEMRPWIQKGDGVFFVNIRADRARMLASIIADKAEELNLFFASMVQYDDDIASHAVFPFEVVGPTVPDCVHEAGLTQAYIAETEKRAHVTYFMHGGREEPYPEEDFTIVPSQGARQYSKEPEMSVEEVAEHACKAIESGKDLVVVNIANPDMVGHTGDFEACVKALEYTDAALAKIVAAVQERDGVCVITADHGNVEAARDVEESERHTSHTASPVPCIVVGSDLKPAGGTLADIAPLVLKLLDCPVPSKMTGKVALD